MKKYLLYIFFVFFIACSQNQDNAQNPESEEMPLLPDQEMWDFEITTTNKGILEAIVKAGHMQRYSDQSTSYFDAGVHIDFFDAEGNIVSVLTADGGELEEATMNVKAIGNVVVVSDTSGTLYTEELYYKKNIDRIYSDVDVKMTRQDGVVVYGKGFESNSDLSDITIKNTYDSVFPGSVDLSMDRYKRSDSTTVTTSDSTDSSIIMPADSIQTADSLITVTE